MKYSRGYTLIELIVAVGLFAIVMLLASGAYLTMIGLNRQVQGISAGVDNLAFALESMTRDIRTGSNYSCGGVGDCASGGSSFSMKNSNGISVSYALSGSAIQKTTNGVQSALTDPSVTITSLTFYAVGTKTTAQNDTQQARVTIVVSGTVSVGPNKPPQSFTIETGASMRGSDI